MRLYRASARDVVRNLAPIAGEFVVECARDTWIWLARRLHTTRPGH